MSETTQTPDTVHSLEETEVQDVTTSHSSEFAQSVDDWVKSTEETVKWRIDPVNYYASHPDLRSLPGLRFPGQIGEPVTRVGQAGWRMFFYEPTVPSHENKLRLAGNIKRFTDVCVEILTEVQGVGVWAGVLREALQRLGAKSGEEQWTAVTVDDCSKCMGRLIGARNLFLQRSDLRRGHLRGRRPIQIPKGFRPFLASLDRWIEASVWIQPGHESGISQGPLGASVTLKRSHEADLSDDDMEPPSKMARTNMEETGRTDQTTPSIAGFEQQIAKLEAENRKLRERLAEIGSARGNGPRRWAARASDWMASFWS